MFQITANFFCIISTYTHNHRHTLFYHLISEIDDSIFFFFI